MVGLVLQQMCSGSSISNNTIANHDLGIVVELFVDDVTISNNVITNHSENGIEIIDFADNCIITGNTIVNNNNGIYMMESDNNIFYENIFTDNQVGIYSIATFDNLFHHNNFIDNGGVYSSVTSTSVWNNGSPPEGNYCSDDKERYYNATEVDGSGVWNTPYVLDESNQIKDNYPLVNPWSLD